MIKSKLHNPIIAKNSHIENAVVQKVSNAEELFISDLENIVPIVPETGRIWFNTDKGSFHFANIGAGGNDENYVDEFLSKTDLRPQDIVSKVDFNDTVNINNTTNGESIFKIDSTTRIFTINGVDQSTTLSGNVTISVTGNVTETVSSSKQLNVTDNLGFKIGKLFKVTDSSNNSKISANNTLNALNINYATIGVNGQTETHTLSDKFVINDGSTDKFIIDNTNDKVSIVYSEIETTSTDVFANVTNIFKLTNGTTNKIVANHSTDSLDITYAETNINGNATIDGNMVVTGDLTIGGQATKVNIAAENMTIADNVIILNSNLTTEDPRLASAIVDTAEVDNNAGVAVNRGSEGVLNLIKWIESTDTTNVETLKEATANVSIWNYESATPSYELHQILDAYSAARQTAGKSGTSWIGYDGYVGSNYTMAIAGGATPAEALEYSYKLDADSLDNTLDSIVQEIDSLKYNANNTTRVGETPSAGTVFTISHNLGTVYVDVVTQREEDGEWYFDILPIQVIDENTVKIELTESAKIRYMISAVEGFDINQATELVIV